MWIFSILISQYRMVYVIIRGIANPMITHPSLFSTIAMQKQSNAEIVATNTANIGQLVDVDMKVTSTTAGCSCNPV
jgi:hypothetical protein